MGLSSRREPAGAMRTAEAGTSRSEGRCVWSACRCEIKTMSAWAACGGGSGPRTRRRWPSRAVRTGSNKTVVPSSCQVLVLCPHHVSDAVTARPIRLALWKGSGIRLPAGRPAAASSPAHPDRRSQEAVRMDRAGSQMSPFRGRRGSRTGNQLSPVRSCTVAARAALVHDQIRV
jgi:hypothetical protein